MRATAQVQIEELTPKFAGQNPTSGSDRARTTHRLVDGDTLPTLAFREYGDAARWRDIASLNGIDDPMRISPGTTLFLPDLERDDQGQGR